MSTPEPFVDFPTMWAIMATTTPEHNHERCSYRTENRALLCDCAASDAAVAAWVLAHRRVDTGNTGETGACPDEFCPGWKDSGICPDGLRHDY